MPGLNPTFVESEPSDTRNLLELAQSGDAEAFGEVYLRFYVDDSLAGIAVALGCSVGTVKSRLFHALDKLRGMNALNAQFVNLKSQG